MYRSIDITRVLLVSDPFTETSVWQIYDILNKSPQFKPNISLGNYGKALSIFRAGDYLTAIVFPKVTSIPLLMSPTRMPDFLLDISIATRFTNVPGRVVLAVKPIGVCKPCLPLTVTDDIQDILTAIQHLFTANGWYVDL